MSENLTPFEGENLASYEALRTAILLADGFTLIFAVTNTEAGAQEVMRRLWRGGVRYQKAWLRDPDRPLVDQVVESVRTRKQPVMVLGLEGLTTVGEEMGRSLRNLNWTRPQWTARLPQTLVFWVTTDMEPFISREAPDLWRFRSLRVEFHFGLLPRAARAAEISKRLRTVNLSPRVRLANLIELFRLTKSQSTLHQAVSLIARSDQLPWQEDLEQLRRLSLGTSEIEDASFNKLGPMPRLQSLIVNYAHASDEAISSFLDRSKPTRLEYADFRGTPIGKRTLKELLKIPDLKGLDLGSTLITRNDLRELPQFTELVYLELKGKLVTDEELSFICTMKSLRVLLLARSEISDTGLTCLPNLDRLWILELDGTNVTSKSLLPISTMKNLSILNLDQTRVSDMDIEMLANLPRVQRIYLRDTDVSDAAVRMLREMFETRRKKVTIEHGRFVG